MVKNCLNLSVEKKDTVKNERGTNYCSKCIESGNVHSLFLSRRTAVKYCQDIDTVAGKKC